MTVVSLELNEVNFDFIAGYVASGKLPNFGLMLQHCQMFETISEKAYPQLEPWIQWPTVYTGKSYAEHQIFRLGDAVGADHRQIWEELESQGHSVGAISPMNAANRCSHPDFFLPDPWTNTEVTADPRTEKLFNLIRQMVNDNASSDLSTFALGRQILPLALPYLHRASLARYLAILPIALQHKWAKAGFLDSLLADLFLSLVARHKSDFASLFLNAGAHIQHHHMYDSSAYDGDLKNPAWYSSAADGAADPLLFIYSVYDRILGQLLARPGWRIMITTGLSQIPNEKEHYQYRIVDFEGFFSSIGLADARIEPRMSRDFLLAFQNAEAAEKGAALLDRVQCADKPLFIVENRGDTLFCQVGYFGPPEGLKSIVIDGQGGDHSANFTLVSIENAIHQTKGYHLDSAIPRSSDAVEIPLATVHNRLIDAVVSRADESARAA